MQVSKWGNSLAVRFPASLVQALDLKEGEEIDLHLVVEKSFEVTKKLNAKALPKRLHDFRGCLPANFHFDRLQANDEVDTPWRSPPSTAMSCCIFSRPMPPKLTKQSSC